MSQIQSSPSLRSEDYPTEYRNLTQRLFVVLNSYFQSVSQTVNGNLDYSSNVKALTKDYTVSGFQSFSFTWPYDVQPVSLNIVKGSKGSQNTPCILLAAWKYDASNKTVTITNILEASSTGINSLVGSYSFTLRVTI